MHAHACAHKRAHTCPHTHTHTHTHTKDAYTCEIDDNTGSYVASPRPSSLSHSEGKTGGFLCQTFQKWHVFIYDEKYQLQSNGNEAEFTRLKAGIVHSGQSCTT